LSLAGTKLHYVDSINDVLAMHEWLGVRREHNVLSFDTETTGLVVGVDRVRLVQVGDGVHGWAMPFERWGGLFEDLVRRWDGMWTAHNAKYDVGMLDHEGIHMPRERVRDTRIMHHVLYPQYSTALKNIADRLIDANASAGQDELHKAIGGRGSWTWATVPLTFQPYWSYAALDTVLGYKTYELLWPQVQADCPEAFELENSVSWVIEKMERNGVHIDLLYAREKLAAFEEYVERAEKWCLEHYGVKPGSNASIVKILQGEDYEFTKATASGAVALDKEVLGAIDHPLAQTVLQRRQLQKLASTYLGHFTTELDADHLIHPSINVLGARTSRMSMERPNLQNLPRKSNHNPAAETIRNCVDTRWDDGSLVMGDFDQVEMRLLASMADETSMIEAFKGETDFFVALARMIYSDESIMKPDPRRQVTKNAGYATIYGAGIAKFSATAGIPFEQGQAVRQRWDALFPRVLAFQQQVQSLALQRRHTEGIAYVRCPVTRRRQVADAGKEYALVNFLIQGAAAAVLKKKVLECDAAGLSDWMIALVHDEIILDVPGEHVRDAAKTLHSIMNDDTMFTVPLTASISSGRRWGAKEAYEI